MAQFQIFNDGAVIRIENGTRTLLVSKEQVKTIDTVQNNIVRIDIGEGPLKNIFINYQDVTNPALGSANELRDLIKGWMLSDNYSGGDATEATQVSILNQLAALASVMQAIKDTEADFTRSEPSRTDESNPNTVYKGWHGMNGDPGNTEWAILRIRRVDDIILHEWAMGTKVKTNKWDDRETLPFVPYINPLEAN